MASISYTVFFMLLALSLAERQTNRYQRLETASRSFSQDILYPKVAQGLDESVVYSPFSIHDAFSMLYRGATGTTRQEIASALGYQNADSSGQYSRVIASLQSAPSTDLNIANAIFPNVDANVKQDYRQVVESTFNAKATALDYNDPDNASETINNYVSRQTNGLINDIIPSGVLGPFTQLVLINAIYFNGEWDTDLLVIENKPFTTLTGQKLVTMLLGLDPMTYKQDDTLSAQIVGVPLRGDRFSFYIVLPVEIDGINHLEQVLANDTDARANLFSGMTKKQVGLTMPQFSISTSLDLKSVLSQSMPNAFEQQRAEFGWITDQDTYVSDARHQASIDVTKFGIQATAATPVIGVFPRMGQRGPEVEVVANHPFMFFLRDGVTGQVLFQGKYSG